MSVLASQKRRAKSVSPSGPKSMPAALKDKSVDQGELWQKSKGGRKGSTHSFIHVLTKETSCLNQGPGAAPPLAEPRHWPRVPS